MSKVTALTSLYAKGLHLVPWSNRNAEQRKPLWKGWAEGDQPSLQSILNANTEWPLADWAIVPKGFVVIDLDIKNGNNGVDVFGKWCEDNKLSTKEVTQQCAIVKTFSGGLHIYFRYEGSKSKTVNAGGGVEFKLNNASVHVPPSEGYTWLQPLESIEKLPLLPSFIEAHWEKKEEAVERDYKSSKYKNGERRSILCTMAAALRNASLRGEELYTALSAVAKNRCEGDFPDIEVQQIAKDYSGKECFDILGQAIEGDNVSRGLLRFALGIEEPVRLPAVPVQQQQVIIEDPVIDRSITHPNPVIGAWVDCVDFNNPMNQPVYSLASAIAGLATLMGRKYVCNGSFANQYIVMLGKTSTGKNAPLSCTKAILRALKADHLVAASKIASGAGMIAEMGTKNELIWCIDEIAFLLRGIAHKSAAPHIIDLNANLLQLYSGSTFEGVSKVDGVGSRIETPYPNILGAAQPSTFQDSLTTEFIESGFLGRFMLLRGNDDYLGKPFGTYKGSDKNPIIPNGLVEALSQTMGDWNSAITNGIGLKKNGTEIHVTQDGATSINDYFIHLADLRTKYDSDGQSAMADVISKNREKLIKLAMVHAYSRNIAAPEIDSESIAWARKVVNMADAVMNISTTKMSTNEVQKVSNRLLDLIEKCGKDGIDNTALTYRSRWLKLSERASQIEDLIAANLVTRVYVKHAKGRSTPMYYLTKYAPQPETTNA